MVTPDLLDDKAPALSECDGCEIQWKEGKNLTVTEVKKKQKAKGGKNKGQVMCHLCVLALPPLICLYTLEI